MMMAGISRIPWGRVRSKKTVSLFFKQASAVYNPKLNPLVIIAKNVGKPKRVDPASIWSIVSDITKLTKIQELFDPFLYKARSLS